MMAGNDVGDVRESTPHESLLSPGELLVMEVYSVGSGVQLVQNCPRLCEWYSEEPILTE